MNERKIILGIDTSNYTTSVALIYSDGEIIANLKYPLPVKTGERGLRQSDAVFAHTKNLPFAMQKVKEILNGRALSAVGVSTRPRNKDGSYMPCFLAGVSAAESVSAAANIPLFRYSHQCGHIMAAILSSGRYDLLNGEEFCAFHVSGGTTDMICAKSTRGGFHTQLLGGTADLNAGQVIDRIGVYMGMPFPAGAHVEKLALDNISKIPNKKPKIKDFKVNLSGLENLAVNLYENTKNRELTSAFVLDYVGKSLISLAENYQETFGKSRFLFAGGVMSCTIIKSMLEERFDASFATPDLSSDNAVGIAALTARETI